MKMERKQKITFNQLKNLVMEGINLEKDRMIPLRVSVAWDTEYPEEYPDTVYVKVPESVWNDMDTDVDLSGNIGRYFDGEVDDFWFNEVEPSASSEWLLWTEDGLVEE